MRLKYAKKWDKYTIGNVHFINARKTHPSRKLFVDWVRENKIKSIMEIGAGELVEAKQLKDLDYLIVDLSKLFIGHAEDEGFKTIKKCMCLVDSKRMFDVVYMNSVLEHTPNVEMAIKNLKKQSKRFFITMFKWSFNSKHSLRSFYVKGNYFSTLFDIDKLFKLFNQYGTIEGGFASNPDSNEILPYKKYLAKFNRARGYHHHRNGTHLSFYGTWNTEALFKEFYNSPELTEFYTNTSLFNREDFEGDK